ncbi:MAG: hypothetical protein ABIK37_07385 [candidate division WOR-3 bacterium]
MMGRVVVFGCVAIVSLSAGYGGFETTLGYPGFGGLNQRFTELHTAQPPAGWGEPGRFACRGPLWWFGGHGGGIAGPVSLGGRGAISARQDRASALEAQFAGALAGFEVGYPYAPERWFWVRPCLELVGGAWVHYVHSNESFSEPNFSRYFLAWTFGVTPAVEVMGRLRYGGESFVGLFLKPGWYVPFAGPVWTGDSDPPRFSIKGFSLQVGLRFGRYPFEPMRI